MEWSVATRHHSLKFKTLPRPHLIIRRIICSCLAHLVWRYRRRCPLGPNRPTQLGAKNQLDQSIFQNFGANPLQLPLLKRRTGLDAVGDLGLGRPILMNYLSPTISQRLTLILTKKYLVKISFWLESCMSWDIMFQRFVGNTEGICGG